MGRYEGVRRGTFHVGVRNKETGWILHLQEKDGLSIISLDEDDGSWRLDERFTQMGDDDEVQSRYNLFMEHVRQRNEEGKPIRYHPTGDIERGMNCENLASLVLEGHDTPRNGNIVLFLEDVGIDVDSFYRLSSSSRSSSRNSSESSDDSSRSSKNSSESSDDSDSSSTT